MDNFYKDLYGMSESLNRLKKSQSYDVNKLVFSLKHLVGQLEYYYCDFLPKNQGDNYIPKEITLIENSLVYINLGRGFPKEIMDGHWCYVLKNYGYKLLVIPTTSVKADSMPINPKYEKDIQVMMNGKKAISRMQLSDMRSVDAQRVYTRKNVCQVITSYDEICEFVKSNIF